MTFYPRIIYTILLAATGSSAFAQLSAGPAGLFMKSGTILSSEGMVLEPSADLSINNTTIARSATAVSSDAGNSINRVYAFSNPITFTGNAGLYYLDAELNGNTASQLAIAYKTETEYVTGTSSTVDISNKLVSQTLNNVSIQLLTGINSNVVLPVEVRNFLARTVNSHVKISWETLTEKDNNFFEIERSADGHTFSLLTKVKGDVYSNSAKHYQAFDYAPIVGDNFYRLSQYDKDGRKTDCGVVHVRSGITENTAVRVYPNPIEREVNLEVTEARNEDLNVSLFSLNGQLVHQEQIKSSGNSHYKLQLDKKPAVGQYLLRVDGKGIKYSTKVLVY